MPLPGIFSSKPGQLGGKSSRISGLNYLAGSLLRIFLGSPELGAMLAWIREEKVVFMWMGMLRNERVISAFAFLSSSRGMKISSSAGRSKGFFSTSLGKQHPV